MIPTTGLHCVNGLWIWEDNISITLFGQTNQIFIEIEYLISIIYIIGTIKSLEIFETHAQVRFSKHICIRIVDEILGPTFYNETLTQDRCLSFVQSKFQGYLHNLPLAVSQNLWFLHNGAAARNETVVTIFLRNEFDQNCIDNRGRT